MRGLIVRSVFILALSFCLVAWERARADDIDEILKYVQEIAYGVGLQSGWDYALEDNIHDSVAAIMYDNRDALYYWTNSLSRLPDDGGHGPAQYGVRKDLLQLNRFFTDNRTTILPGSEYAPYKFSFYNWSDAAGYGTDSFAEFLSLTLGSMFDMEALDEIESDDEHSATNAWDHAFELDRFIFDGYPAAVSYTAWEAEAWRRLLSAVTVQTNVWNTSEGTNVWNDILIDSTNGVPRVPVSPTNLWDASLTFVSNSVPTNTVLWGQYGATNTSPDMAQPLIKDIGWQWTAPESGAYEVGLFRFSQLDPALTGTLSIDFTDNSWGIVNKAAKFFWALGTAVFMFMLLRNEWNFWTTLGGSAT